MRQAWATFAHDSEQGLSTALGWPLLSDFPQDVMVLGLNDTLDYSEDAEVWNAPCVTEYSKS